MSLIVARISGANAIMSGGYRPISNLPIGAIRAFEAASRLGSFKEAAAELAVSSPAISHQVKALEDRLGAPLFVRSNRSLRLTEVGERLATAAQGAFSQLSNAFSNLAADGLIAEPTTLTVSAAPSLAAKWLAPRLPEFAARHPSIQLRLHADTLLTDFGTDPAIDVGLRYGAGPYEATLHAELLWERSEIFPVCAPSLVSNGKLTCPADLLERGVALLRTAAPAGASGAAAIGWAAWFHAAGVTGVAVERALRRAPVVGSSQLALETASAGRGVALAPAQLVIDDIRVGRLVQPFPVSVPDPFAFWIVYRADRAGETRIRIFRKWVQEAAAADQIGKPDRVFVLPLT